MTVSVDIESARRDQALVVPVRDVYDMLSGTPWIMGVRDGRAVKRPVSLGVRGNSDVEILDGAAEGDLAIPVTANLLTGQRLRPVRP
jgi:HlyD family secretion protein